MELLELVLESLDDDNVDKDVELVELLATVGD
jgi:hypothetical protein